MKVTLNPAGFFWILFISDVCTLVYGKDYCSTEPNHVFCESDLTFGRACGLAETIGFVKVSELERNEILKAHNELRNIVAKGKEHRGRTKNPQSPASNMMQMYWDNELEEAALSTASKCLLRFSCVACLKLERFQARELIYKRDSLVESNRNVSWSYIIERLYIDDLKEFNESFVKNYRALKKPNGFAYIVDARSSLVGCGKITFKNDNKFSLLAVCTYGPADENATSIYEEGEPCSNCPPLTKCYSTYPNLCSKLMPERIMGRQANTPQNDSSPRSIKISTLKSDEILTLQSTQNTVSDSTSSSETILDDHDTNEPRTTSTPSSEINDNSAQTNNTSHRILTPNFCIYGITFFASIKLPRR